MSKFNVTPRKLVDPAKLAAFTAGAEIHQPAIEISEQVAPPAQPSKESPGTERQTESLLFRLTKADLDEFNFVFDNTNVKSKQKMLESIILPELRRRAKELRN